MTDVPTRPYNDGYTHEALHAAHIIADMWDRHVYETRCADRFPDVLAAVRKAANALQDVYQLIGTKFDDGEPAPPDQKEP